MADEFRRHLQLLVAHRADDGLLPRAPPLRRRNIYIGPQESADCLCAGSRQRGWGVGRVRRGMVLGADGVGVEVADGQLEPGEEWWEAVVHVAFLFDDEVPLLGPVLVPCTALGLLVLHGITLGHLLHLQPELTKLHRLLRVEGETVRTLRFLWCVFRSHISLRT